MISKINNIKDLFDFLNNNCKYVVLRNWEDIFDENIYGTGHQDIDIMCESIDKFINLTSAIRLHNDSHRDNLCVKCGSLHVRFDVRSIGDDYYPIEWQKNILERRKQLPNGIYVMNDTDYVYTLAYHALLQKPNLSDEYRDKILNAYKKVNYSNSISEQSSLDILRILQNYCIQNGYEIYTPNDPGVYINWKNMDKLNAKDTIRKKFRRLKLRITQKFNSIKSGSFCL